MKAADYIRKYLTRASLIVNLLLLLLTAWLLLVLAGKRESASLIPIQDGWARDDSYIGYMRQPKPMAGQDGPFLPDGFELDFLERIPNDSKEPGYDLVRLRLYVADEDCASMTMRPVNFSLLWYCGEDGFWYERYNPNYANTAFFQPLPVGESVLEYHVPLELLSAPGKYAIRFPNFGACVFSLG